MQAVSRLSICTVAVSNPLSTVKSVHTAAKLFGTYGMEKVFIPNLK